jgi:hypothetical protein
MKLQRGHVAVIAAEHAAPTRFRHEELLDSPAPTRDAIGTTLGAPVIALAVEDEASAPMRLAVKLAFDNAGVSRVAPVLDRDRRLRLQAPPAQPVPNRRLTTSEFGGEAALRVAECNESFELGPVHQRMMPSDPDGKWERLFG